MKKNMGTIDRIVRIITALLIVLSYFTNLITGTQAIILGTLAALLIISSSISFCPLYLPFGISTHKKTHNNET